MYVIVPVTLRPYPPMPKSDLAMRGRMYLREELESDFEGETPTFVGRKARKKAAQFEAERVRVNLKKEMH